MKTQKFGVEVEMTGITRREGITALAEYFNTNIVYIGGAYDEWRVSDAQGRAWSLMYDRSILSHKKEGGRYISAGDANYNVELVTPPLNYEDIETLQEVIRILRKLGAVSKSEYMCGIHIHIDGAPYTHISLRNLCNIFYSKQDILYRALNVDGNRTNFCQKHSEGFIGEIKTKPNLEGFAQKWYGFYSPHQDREAKYNRSRYKGLNLHSFFRKGTVEFRLFNGTLHAGEIKSYIQLCLAISHQALTQRSAQATVTISENEKFTFRTWLLRMGMIGEEFETARLHLLKHLEGNSAWRYSEEHYPCRQAN